MWSLIFMNLKWFMDVHALRPTDLVFFSSFGLGFIFVKPMLNVGYYSNANFIGPIRTSSWWSHFISSLNITIFIPKSMQIMWQNQQWPIAKYMGWAMWIIVFKKVFLHIEIKIWVGLYVVDIFDMVL